MNVQVTVVILGVVGKLEGDSFSSTALVVLHGRPASLAGRDMLAGGAIWHLVMELDIHVLGGRDLILVN